MKMIFLDCQMQALSPKVVPAAVSLRLLIEQQPGCLSAALVLLSRPLLPLSSAIHYLAKLWQRHSLKLWQNLQSSLAQHLQRAHQAPHC
jgi:hypothetical protein